MTSARALACACCDGDAGRWQQWPNRDTGYGICRRCVEWVAEQGESPEKIRDDYGVAGVNYAATKEG